MFGWLRRHQPRGVMFGILYWTVLALVALAVLFVIFYQLDNFLPAMF
jgi:hypothetical protein